MTTTLKVERGAGHYGRKPSLEVRFAERTGRTPGSAGQRLSGNNRLETDAVEFLTICREDGRLAEGEGFLHRLQTAFRGERTVPWTPQLVQDAADLDAVEDPRLLAIQVKVGANTATESEVRDYAKVLMREIAAKVRLYDAAIELSHTLRSAK